MSIEPEAQTSAWRGKDEQRISTPYRRTRQTVLRAGLLRAAKDYTRLVAFLVFLQERSSQTVLHCAHQGSTFRSCDLGEPEEWSGCSPPPPKLARYHSPHIALTESPHTTQRRRTSRSSTARVEGNSSPDPITCYEKRPPTPFDDSIPAVSNHHVSRLRDYSVTFTNHPSLDSH